MRKFRVNTHFAEYVRPVTSDEKAQSGAHGAFITVVMYDSRF